AGLHQHLRYPEDIFTIQSHIFATYHMTNPQVFYLKEDQWSVPALEGERNATPMSPYYTIMKLPGEKQAEFIQMLPFTPRLKDNLSAWMVARSDVPHYGRLLAFKFPKQKVVYGPKQVVSKINQDEFISPQVTLWDQQGSRVIWGTLLVIPVNESLIYVLPLYLQSSEGRIPELKQVVVAYQNRIEMAESLTRALSKIFGSSMLQALAPDRLASSATSVVMTSPEEAAAANASPTATPAAGEATMASLVAEMHLHYEAADKALKAGDVVQWAAEQKKA